MLTLSGSLEKRQLKFAGLTLLPSIFQLDGRGWAALLEAPTGEALIIEVHDEHPREPWRVDLRRAPGQHSLPKWHHSWGGDLPVSGFGPMLKLRAPADSLLLPL